MRKRYTKQELFSVPILSLAFIGDGVHTLWARENAFIPTDKNNALHATASHLCCAATQAKAAKKLEPLLTEDERFIYKKGKGATVGSLPKHATLMEYKLATALEAVVGFLYLLGEDERWKELLEAVYKEEE